MTTLSTSRGADSISPEDQTSGLRRDLGPIGLLFSAVGSIIGSGWLFAAFEAGSIAGPAAILSWVIGSVLFMLIGLVYAELGVMFPVAGGVARFPHWSFGSFASYTMGWVTWLAAAAVAPIEVEAALKYTRHYVHWLASPNGTLTGYGYGIAAAAMALFVLVNFMGIRWFARLNNVVVWWKLAIITMVIVAFLVTEFHGANFSSHGFAPAGNGGIFTSVAIAGIAFSFLGFRQGIELAGETKNPRRYVPLAVIGSLVITAIIYILLQVAFIGSLSPSAIAHGWTALANNTNLASSPLAVLAGLIGLSWLGSILYADAIISPGDTGFIYTTVTARLSYAMGRNENAPRQLAATTRTGAPWVSLLLAFVVGLIVFLPFPSWQKLVGFVTGITVLSFGSGPLVLVAMRKQLPGQERPYRLPGGHVIPFLAFWGANMIIYWGGWATDWRLFVAVAIGFVVLAIFVAYEKARGRSLPAMDWRAGAWIVPWFVLLLISSLLSPYGGPAKAWSNEGWGFLAEFVVSVIIYALAYYVRLSPETTARYVAHAGDTTLTGARARHAAGIDVPPDADGPRPDPAAPTGS
jgi:amino acid transporter